MPPIVLLGVPTDCNSSYLRGAAGAPHAIRSALYSDATSLWTERGIDLGAEGVLHDADDLDLGADGDDFDALERGVNRWLDEGARVLAIGGDHAITHRIVRAHARVHAPLSILHLDAHPDLYESFDDNPRSHASPFARILEEGLVKRVVQVGIRSTNLHLREQAERYGTEVIEMREWKRSRAIAFDEPVFVSFDMDVLDPAFAPGVSHWEPGGATVRQVLALFEHLDARVIGADVVELNPERDPSGRTAAVAARVVRELAGKIVESER